MGFDAITQLARILASGGRKPISLPGTPPFVPDTDTTPDYTAPAALPASPPDVRSAAASAMARIIAQGNNLPARAQADSAARPTDFWHRLGRQLQFVAENVASGRGAIPGAISAAAGGEGKLDIARRLAKLQAGQAGEERAAQSQYDAANVEQDYLNKNYGDALKAALENRESQEKAREFGLRERMQTAVERDRAEDNTRLSQPKLITSYQIGSQLFGVFSDGSTRALDTPKGTAYKPGSPPRSKASGSGSKGGFAF